MTPLSAFWRLFLPSLVLFFGLFIFRDRREAGLIGAAICAATLPWLIITTVRVARLLHVEPPIARRGFPVVPIPPDASESAR